MENFLRKTYPITEGIINELNMNTQTPLDIVGNPSNGYINLENKLVKITHYIDKIVSNGSVSITDKDNEDTISLTVYTNYLKDIISNSTILSLVYDNDSNKLELDISLNELRNNINLISSDESININVTDDFIDLKVNSSTATIPKLFCSASYVLLPSTPSPIISMYVSNSYTPMELESYGLINEEGNIIPTLMRGIQSSVDDMIKYDFVIDSQYATNKVIYISNNSSNSETSIIASVTPFSI